MIRWSKSEQASVPSPASETLCTNLLSGMHAAAQPLTILRASLGKGRTDRMSIDEHRELAESSAREVERLCTLFSYMQQLVITASNKPHLCATQISPLLAFVADGVDLLFQSAGMFLRSKVPDIGQPVLIDSARTQQALSSMLLIARSVSTAKDTIELIASPTSGGVQVVVRNLNSFGGAMNAEAGLSMALAEANIRSQQGEFASTLEPFIVTIELRRAPFVH